MPDHLTLRSTVSPFTVHRSPASMCFHLYLASPAHAERGPVHAAEGARRRSARSGGATGVEAASPRCANGWATGPRRLLLRSRGPAAPGEPGRRDLAPAPLPRPGASEDCRHRCAGAPPPGRRRAIPTRGFLAAPGCRFRGRARAQCGPTLYYLHFSHDGTLGVLPRASRRLSAPAKFG